MIDKRLVIISDRDEVTARKFRGILHGLSAKVTIMVEGQAIGQVNYLDIKSRVKAE